MSRPIEPLAKLSNYSATKSILDSSKCVRMPWKVKKRTSTRSTVVATLDKNGEGHSKDIRSRKVKFIPEAFHMSVLK